MYINNLAIFIFWVSFSLNLVLGDYLLAPLLFNQDNFIIYNLLNFELVIFKDHSR
jgi:hypothetical protein